MVVFPVRTPAIRADHFGSNDKESGDNLA